MNIIAKKDNKVTINVIGGNNESVTGSCSIINYNGNLALFEVGTIQDGKTTKENYDLNKKLITNIKNKDEIKYIFCGHAHADHSCNIPSLYTYNCDAKIIVPVGTSKILKEMWLDSAYINQRDCEYLSLKFERKYEPLYTENEVYKALNHIVEYPFHEIIELDECLSFRFSHAGHILLSAQTELFFSINGNTKKVTFSSDLGNPLLNDTKVFVDKFEPVIKSNIFIGEATYAAKNRSMTKKDLKTDLGKIKSVIQQFCVENKKTVVIPCFSLDRSPYILWLLYSIFGQDESFNIPIIIDSPLSIRLLNAYGEILQGDVKEKFSSMMNWKNLKLSYTPEDSKSCMADGKAKCVISSSGMLSAGRSVKWVQHVLPHSDNCILFIGFATTNTLAYKIKNSKNKNGKKQKTITINGKAIKNNAQIVDLHSFSSHAQRDMLLKYYSNIIADKIYLVHSNMNDKIEFKADLEEEIRKKLRTTKVIATNRSTRINV